MDIRLDFEPSVYARKIRMTNALLADQKPLKPEVRLCPETIFKLYREVPKAGTSELEHALMFARKIEAFLK